MMIISKYYLWSAIGRFGSQIFGFVGNVLVARVLFPSDYGLIAMLAIVMGLAWNFTDSGFSDYLIQKRGADKQDFGTAATFNLATAIIIYTCIFLGAPRISSFFGKDELVGVARILGVSLIIKAVTLPAIVSLRKDLKFKSLAIMQLTTVTTSIFLTYILALKGVGYWALAMQPIFVALSNLIFVLVVEHWRPYFCFSLVRFKEMYSYCLNMLVSYITNQLGNNLYSTIIGKLYPVTSLGFYQQAFKMKEVPTQGLNAVILTTSYSLIAKESDTQKQIQMYRDIFARFVALQSIMVLSLIGLAKPIWLLLLGDKWHISIPLFQLFMIISFVNPLVTINSNIVKIHNKPKLYRNLTFLRNGLKVIALLIFAKTSLITLLYGQIGAVYMSAMVDMYFCGRIIEFGAIEQLELFIMNSYKPLFSFGLTTLVVKNLDFGLYISGLLWVGGFVGLLIILYHITQDQLFYRTVVEVKRLIISKFN